MNPVVEKINPKKDESRKGKIEKLVAIFKYKEIDFFRPYELEPECLSK